MCRVRNVHTTAPWSTAYICITIDETCTDENNKFVDKPLTVRMVQWQPFCTKKPFDPKTPVCASCKRTNRTRSFCRERHKHRHLPWCTVYVLLSALDQTDPNTVVAGASKKVEGEENEEENGGSTNGEESKPKAEDASAAGSETIGSEADGESDDINEIPESRTFLAKVSCRSTSIHWLEMAEFDGTADPNFAPPVQTTEPQAFSPPAHAADPHAQYFAAMGYAAQQHQNALKSHQQYFFQMQQRQQQQQFSPSPAAQWQYGMGQGDASQSGTTAGESAAAHNKRGHDDSYQALQQQQWALYYAQPFGQEGHHGPPGMHSEHDPYQEANGESDDVDVKRQRVV